MWYGCPDIEAYGSFIAAVARAFIQDDSEDWASSYCDMGDVVWGSGMDDVGCYGRFVCAYCT